ncbi:MAG: inositol monophosphatase family protein [Chloroflexota bacterium]
MKLTTYLEFAVETAYLAGRATLGYFRAGVRPDFKEDDTPVTAADRLSEELIRRRIEERYPNHAIVGEEYGAKGTESAAFRWFVDPIDGTKSFIRGVPLYAVLIGLEIEGEPRVGAAYFPALDEMLSGATGLGAWCNGRRAHVSDCASLDRAFMACTNPASFARHGKQAAFERLMQKTYYCTGWSDAYGYLLVATGRLELMLDPVMEVWDCGPFPPILAEAGGYFGDWRGNVTVCGREAMSTTQKLLPDVLGLLQG